MPRTKRPSKPRCKCPRCGEPTQRTRLCMKCQYSEGVVWTLDEDTWTWTKEERTHEDQECT